MAWQVSVSVNAWVFAIGGVPPMQMPVNTERLRATSQTPGCFRRPSSVVVGMVLRQVLPLAASPHHIEDRTGNLAQIEFNWASWPIMLPGQQY